jgi:hypothetical protein
MSKEHELGSAPIDEEYKAKMNAVARVLDEIFNEDLKGPARTTGFVLLVFPFGEREGRCNYISNGADRKDIIKLLREQANRFDTGVQ